MMSFVTPIKHSAGIITTAPNISLSEEQWRVIASALAKDRSFANLA
jgi:hypothetical protein